MVHKRRFNRRRLPQNDSKRDGKQKNKRPTRLSSDLTHNITVIKEDFGNSSDVMIRSFEMLEHHSVRATVVYLDGLVDERMVDEFIDKCLQAELLEEINEEELYEYIKERARSISKAKTISSMDNVYEALLSGDSVIFVDGISHAVQGSTNGGDRRNVEVPETEVSTRGPKEGFNESIRTNTSLVRRRIHSKNLWIESFKIGKETKTRVEIMFLKHVADEKVVKKVRDTLKKIEVDEIILSHEIEEFLQENSLTVFPTVFTTERPDVMAGNILEGRVGIFVDGTPFNLVVPVTIAQFLQASEDYTQPYHFTTLIRILRYFSFFISLLGPSIYIAAVTFHQNVIPTQLAISLAAQREGIPFPVIIEALIMEITFEILREAGLRMPRALGQAVSIVGALVIGQAAVQAGIVSAFMVIIVAGTGIASFTTPAYSLSISARILRFAFMILAATFGFYGIVLASLFVAAHLCSLHSFGVPYMSPFAPFKAHDQKDALIKLPINKRLALDKRDKNMNSDS